MGAYFPQARVVGLGGATEAAVWSNYYPIERVEAGQRSIPYGKPLANNEFYILDPFGAPVPAGVAGELHIGGAGVARGYMNDSERTAAAFVANPFRPGETMYRTGDLGRLLADGNMEFLGRKDHQVKVRGYRIELGEIEYRLRQHEGVREAVVIARPDASGAAQLCAYAVAERGSGVTAAELRAYAAKTLPEYMLPSHITFLEELPLSANGKIDRKALPAPEGLREAGERTAPATETERMLAAAWQELLGLPAEAIGRSDDFFALGGHSLLAATLAARMTAELGVELPLPLLFRYPTIEGLAARLDQLHRFRGEPERPVTRLNGGGESGLNVFCFPPVAGYGFEYKGLAEALPEYAWYAFDFHAEGNDATRARDYAQWIRELQPEGPYVLLGYSAGGNTAYEVARELEASGQKVSDVIVLDSRRKIEAVYMSEEDMVSSTEDQLRAAEPVYGDLLAGPSLRREAFERIMAYRRYLNAMVNAVPLVANIRVVLAENSDVSSSWMDASSGKVTMHQGSGTHIGMLEGRAFAPNVNIIKALLQAVMLTPDR
jgi:thioesterase domain-containing protein